MSIGQGLIREPSVAHLSEEALSEGPQNPCCEGVGGCPRLGVGGPAALRVHFTPQAFLSFSCASVFSPSQGQPEPPVIFVSVLEKS